MTNYLDKTVLITTSNWFYAPDGKLYRAVYGKLKSIIEASKVVGFVPNRAHANWFVEIGDMIIMGCQVLYIVQCDAINSGAVLDMVEVGGLYKEVEKPTAIYNAAKAD